MSATILDNNFTVYFTNDTGGDLQIRRTSGTTVYSFNQLYSELQDLFDNNTAGVGDYMDEGIPLSASTPTQYTIGKIETNDNEPWFIDPETIKYLRGGALVTSGWTYVSGTTNGVFRIPLSSLGTIVAGDIGNSVSTSAGSMTGTLIAVDTVRTEIWIRPTSESATHNWATVSSGTITCNAHTCTQNAAGVTGENEWANLFTIGTIETETSVFIYQDKSKIAAWWSSGHIDVIILVTLQGTLLDYGTLIVFARQYSKLYDHSIVDASQGGRIPVALSTSSDINNATGYRSLTVSGVTGTFNSGNFIYFGASWAAATKKGVLTNVSGTTLTYYLIGDLTDFANTNAITEWTGSANDATATVNSAPIDAGPADLATDPTINFGATSQDIGDGDGNQPYDVHINVQGNTLADFYQYTKYLTRRGYTDDLDPNADQLVTGESYLATGDIKANYDNETVANFTEGETITGNGGQEGVITSLVDSGLTGTLVIRETRGTFADNTHITGTTSTAQADLNGTPSNVTIFKTAPFGTFAGGNFFGARGVWITDMHANDANSYTLIDSNGVVRTPPASVSIVVGGLVSGDRVAVFRATDTNGTIEKNYLTLAAGNNSGNTTLVVNETIPTDTPASGVVRIIDDSDITSTKDRRYSYTSISAPSTFNGITKLFGALDAGLDRNYTANDDTAYVPYIDTQAVGVTASVSVIYDTDRNITTRVRRKGIIPFTVNNISLTDEGYSATAVRTEDTIVD